MLLSWNQGWTGLLEIDLRTMEALGPVLKGLPPSNCASLQVLYCSKWPSRVHTLLVVYKVNLGFTQTLKMLVYFYSYYL